MSCIDDRGFESPGEYVCDTSGDWGAALPRDAGRGHGLGADPEVVRTSRADATFADCVTESSGGRSDGAERGTAAGAGGVAERRLREASRGELVEPFVPERAS